MVGDPIADLLTRITNSQAIGSECITMPYSQMRMDILSVLEKKGYISKASKKGRKNRKVIEVELSYTDGAPRVQGARRISKQSRRMYIGFRDLKPVRQGTGTLVLSTPKGVLSDTDARKQKVGGEALLEIW